MVDFRLGMVALMQTDPNDRSCRPTVVFVTKPFVDESSGKPSVVIVPITLATSFWLGDPTCEMNPTDHELIKGRG